MAAPLLDLDVTPESAAAPDASRIFKPNAKQLAYLAAWLDPTQPKTISGIAKALGIERKTIQLWRLRPDFLRWFNEHVDAETEHLWRPLLLKITQLGLQGSVEHAKLMAQIRGVLRADESPRHGGVTVIVGVPRSGDPVPLPADPPRPALAAAVSSSEH